MHRARGAFHLARSAHLFVPPGRLRPVERIGIRGAPSPQPRVAAVSRRPRSAMVVLRLLSDVAAPEERKERAPPEKKGKPQQVASQPDQPQQPEQQPLPQPPKPSRPLKQNAEPSSDGERGAPKRPWQKWFNNVYALLAASFITNVIFVFQFMEMRDTNKKHSVQIEETKKAADKQVEATLKTAAVEQEKRKEEERHQQLLVRLEQPHVATLEGEYISRAEVPGNDETDKKVENARTAILTLDYMLIEGPSRTGKTTFVDHCLAGHKGVVFVSLKGSKPRGSITAELGKIFKPLEGVSECCRVVPFSRVFLRFHVAADPVGALTPLFVEFSARNNMRPTVVIDDVQKALDHGGPDAAADLQKLGSLRQKEIIRLVFISSEPVSSKISSAGECNVRAHRSTRARCSRAARRAGSTVDNPKLVKLPVPRDVSLVSFLASQWAPTEGGNPSDPTLTKRATDAVAALGSHIEALMEVAEAPSANFRTVVDRWIDSDVKKIIQFFDSLGNDNENLVSTADEVLKRTLEADKEDRPYTFPHKAGVRSAVFDAAKALAAANLLRLDCGVASCEAKPHHRFIADAVRKRNDAGAAAATPAAVPPAASAPRV